MLYKTIICDPPWPEKGGGRIKRGADRHYPLMSVKQILDMADFVKGLADTDCHLYLWTTNNYLAHGLAVMNAYGFRYITAITWMKDRMGLGQYFRGMTEHCLFGVKGNLPYKLDDDGKRMQGKTGFFAPKTIHSAKPAALREMAERVSYGPRIELFAREKVLGWDAWGMDVGFGGIQRPEESIVHNENSN